MQRVYRRENALTLAAIFFVQAVFFANAAMDPVGILERVIETGLALAGVAFAERSLRLGVYFDSNDVVVRNVLRTHTLTWSDVRSIEMRSAAPFGVPTPSIERHDGRWIVLRGVEPPNPMFRPNNPDAERAVTLLQNELERHRSAA